MLTTLLKQRAIQEYIALCGCKVRLFHSEPPMSNLTTTSYCKLHQPRSMDDERDKIHSEAISYFNGVSE